MLMSEYVTHLFSKCRTNIKFSFLYPVSVLVGEGGCAGSTAELGFNYIADISTKNEGGMFTIEDLPYDLAGVGEGDDKCSALTEGKTAMVGITGWTLLPSNSYKATMNALAKVSYTLVSETCQYSQGILFLKNRLPSHFCNTYL